MAIAFKDLQDTQTITEKNFDEKVEEIRRIIEETTEEFEDVPF